MSEIWHLYLGEDCEIVLFQCVRKVVVLDRRHPASMDLYVICLSYDLTVCVYRFLREPFPGKGCPALVYQGLRS